MLFFNFYFFSPSLPLLLFSFSSPLSPVLWRWAQLFVSCPLRIVLHCPEKAFVLFQRACAATQSLVVSASHRSTGMKTTTSCPSWEKTALRTQTWNLIIIPVRRLESSEEKICLIFADLQKYPETWDLFFKVCWSYIRPLWFSLSLYPQLHSVKAWSRVWSPTPSLALYGEE